MNVFRTVGIVGLGAIGLKLTQYFASHKIHVIAYNWRDLDKKESIFRQNIEKQIKDGKSAYSEVVENANYVEFTGKMIDLKRCDFVFESATEKYDIKQELYSKLKTVLSEQAVLATTTSSLSIAELSECFDKKRFIGVHFFNPPVKMKLVELSFLPENSPDIKMRTYDFLNLLKDRKIIELPLVQGYVVNRILFVYINYAMEYAQETGISISNIDSAMKSGANFPMGPFELSDYIGNDITLQILNEFYSSLTDSRYKPAKLLLDVVANGWLGRKSKQGFYNY